MEGKYSVERKKKRRKLFYIEAWEWYTSLNMEQREVYAIIIIKYFLLPELFCPA